MSKQLSLILLLMCGLFMISTPITYAAQENSSGDNGSDKEQKDEGGTEESSDSSGETDQSGLQDKQDNSGNDQPKEKEKIIIRTPRSGNTYENEGSGHKDECDDPDSEACRVSRQDNNDMSDQELAEKNMKDGGDLTIILKLKYPLAGKWYKNVNIEVGKYFEKKYDLSKQPSKITIKHLKIPEGKTFKVSLNNYGSDDGETYNMRNSVCKCPEKISIRVP